MAADDVVLGPEDPVEALRGVGPRTAAALREVGVFRVIDLLLWLPSRYQDRRAIRPLASLSDQDRHVLVRGRVGVVTGPTRWRKGRSVVRTTIADASGTLAVVWFNQPWMAERLVVNREYLLFGPVGVARSGGLQLSNPEVDDATDVDAGASVTPVYPRCGPLAGRRLRHLLSSALEATGALPDPLPDDVVGRYGLPSFDEAVRALHRPEWAARSDPSAEDPLEPLSRRQTSFHRRLAFDEVLGIACVVVAHRARRRRLVAPVCGGPSPVDRSDRLLPFRLTGAQRRVLAEISEDLRRDVPMARLVQGDVGCGKTAVAALAALQVLESGRQVAVMAPTELLAEQHHRAFTELLSRTGFRPRLLVSSLPARERHRAQRDLSAGSATLVVGTHALFQPSVDYPRLGLAVVDEQHRFGVSQRQALVDKGTAPHLLVMTATPIPRTLTMTLYGDLDLSIIDELPPGRRPVKTVVRTTSARHRLLAFIRREITAGGRAYVVCPLIDPSPRVAARAVEEQRDEISQSLPGVGIGVLHGRLSREDRDLVYARFRRGELQVLIATTVVEVGVDVPQATVMVVESAERFGLAQLHQLRGRVGRGSRPSWCVLMVEEQTSAEARRRLEVFAATSDGFEIAEADLQMRGPGEVAGLRQSGHAQLRFADPVRDVRLIEMAHSAARDLDRSGRLAEVGQSLSRTYAVAGEVGVG